MKKRIIIGGIIVLFFLMLLPFLFYKYNLNSIGKDEEVIFEISSGTSTIKVIEQLKENELIRDIFSARLYAYLHKPSIQAGKYRLNKNMNVSDIIEIFNSGNVINENIIVTFKEGKRIPNYVSKISESFNYTEKEIYDVINDKSYLEELINNYWFITDDILNKDIYYALEGYLYPDTYEFSKDATIKDILSKMLNEMENKLEPFKEKIIADDRTFHEILTLASIVEVEASSYEDRKEVAGIFYNRIRDGWTLGSDVTTYYAAKKEFTDELSEMELIDCNAYNTRSTCLRGLPVSPIASTSITSIDAVLNYNNTDNYFFVADKNKKVYFSKTNSEHQRVIATLKSQDLWYNY